MNELTPEQKHHLEMFAYYCRGYGYKEVDGYLALYDECSNYNIDEMTFYGENNFHLGSYDEIDKTIHEIIQDNDLLDEFSGEGYNGNLVINIDCIEKTIEIIGEEEVYDVNSDVYTIEDVTKLDPEDRETFEELFSEMNKKRVTRGEVQFNGSGDEGEIYDNIEFENNTSMGISENVLNYLYDWLESSLDGWEINEGSYGKFVFHSKNRTINLNINERKINMESLGEIFFAKF
jgi:hypothetical protein